MTHDPFEAADRFAPVPGDRDAPVDAWVRHHAATALAAWAVFHAETRAIPRNPESGSRPEIGYLSALAVASMHAAVALNHRRAGRSRPMTLTKRQFTETALTLVSEHLADLLDPAYEMNDWIDRKLCQQHCPAGRCGQGGSDRPEEDMQAELDGVKQEIRDAVTLLREVLVSRLAEVSR